MSVAPLRLFGGVFWERGAEFVYKLVDFTNGEYLRVAFEKAPQNFYTDEVYCADGVLTDMISSVSGIFLDGVQFLLSDSGLRIQFLIVTEGAMPIGAYQIIGNSFIRQLGTSETLSAHAVERSIDIVI